MERRSLEFWFYIGLLLTLYGVLLLGGGVYQWFHPPATVLAGKHATFWAGLILCMVGGAYTVAYWPRNTSARKEQQHKQQ